MVRAREGRVNGAGDVWPRGETQEDPLTVLIIRRVAKKKTSESRTKMSALNSQVGLISAVI